VVNLHEKDLAKVNDWFNHVWSLINLSMASNEQLQSVLKWVQTKILVLRELFKFVSFRKGLFEKLVTKRQGHFDRRVQGIAAGLRK
jgi:hypothetical protein